MASPEESPEAPARVARRKRKRSGDEGPSSSSALAAASNISPTKWRTETEQKSYSTKLIDALRRVRRASSSPELPKSRAVREAADRALAVAAHGRTRWSRAILAIWARKLEARKRRPYARRSISTCSAADDVKKKKNKKDKRKKAPALETKTKVLGRMVPGCRKLSFPTLLEEASGYIAALQMQVRAMTAIAEILAADGSGSAAAAAAEAWDQQTERSRSPDPM